MDAPTRKNARPAQNWSGDVADAGPGEQQNAKRTWLLDRDLSDVLERDVLLVTAGPHEGMKLRVGSVELAQDSRRVHHVEVGVDVWHGELEEAS
jgi:hypothetical protein